MRLKSMVDICWVFAGVGAMAWFDDLLVEYPRWCNTMTYNRS